MSEQKGVHKSRHTTDEAALEEEELGEIQGGSIFYDRQLDQQTDQQTNNEIDLVEVTRRQIEEANKR